MSDPLEDDPIVRVLADELSPGGWTYEGRPVDRLEMAERQAAALRRFFASDEMRQRWWDAYLASASHSGFLAALGLTEQPPPRQHVRLSDMEQP